jgi:single-stranded-DNA-specific exonuclease
MHRCRWHFREVDKERIARLAGELKAPKLFAQCLLNRGHLTAEEALRFLDPKLSSLSDPFLLPNMEVAVERLFEARERAEPLVIFGDYDVDGITSTALLSEFFSALGWRCSHYLPHRMEEGYGLSPDGVENCLAKFEVKLILAVDCGSSSSEVIAALAKRGVEVIVLDHHQIGASTPKARALVNPQLMTTDPGELRLQNLCSAGLAFKLAHALLKRGRRENLPKAFDYDLKQLLDLVALGTLSDMVPLTGENRIFARIGLERLSSSNRPGVKELKKVAGIAGPFDAYQVGFQLGPRLNAAGRLESAMDALELLLSQNPEEAARLAKKLDEQNRERQAVEQKMIDEVMLAVRARFDPERDFAIVEAREEWHIGVVGIVASRVLREFHRPVIILGSDGPNRLRGSGRSVEGFDLASALRNCGELLLKHGGHAMAAGVSMALDRIESFRSRLNAIAREKLTPELLKPSLTLDAEARLNELNFEFLRLLSRLEPTGSGNGCAQFASRDLSCRGEIRRFGTMKQHAKFSVSDGSATQRVIWWNMPENLELPGRFDLAYVPEIEEYNGTLGIQLRALDLREH